MAQGRQLTGRTVAIVAVSAFGVIFAVNMTMAYFATSGFPGLVVRNSYVASQTWDATRAAQEDLGWEVAARLDAGDLVVEITDAEGRPLSGLTVTADLARPTGARGETVVTLASADEGYRVEAPLGEGRWMAQILATGPDGSRWTGTARLWVD